MPIIDDPAPSVSRNATRPVHQGGWRRVARPLRHQRMAMFNIEDKHRWGWVKCLFLKFFRRMANTNKHDKHFNICFFLWRVSEMLIRTQANLEAKLIDMACSSAAKARATHGLDHVSCFASYLSCHFTNFSLTVLFLCSFLRIVILGLNSQAQVWIALRQLRDIWLRLCRVWWLLLVNGLVSSFGLQDVLNTGIPLPPAATCSNMIQEVIFHHPRMVLVSRFETPQLAVWGTQYSFTHTHTPFVQVFEVYENSMLF
jgi:hypothetical protein